MWSGRISWRWLTISNLGVLSIRITFIPELTKREAIGKTPVQKSKTTERPIKNESLTQEKTENIGRLRKKRRWQAHLKRKKDGVLEFMVDGYQDHAEELRGQIAELDQKIEELEIDVRLTEARIEQVRAEQARRKALK